METKKIQNSTLIGEWREVKDLPGSEITKTEGDVAKLSGIILKGYETVFKKGQNENGEIYSKDCIDDFINRYYIENKINLPVDIEHDHRPEWLAGRVIYLESNSVGFYFVVYIPKTFMHYDVVLNLLKEGLLQGFSKEGFASGDYKKKDGKLYFEIQKMDILRLSLVATPANATLFDNMQETKNQLVFKKTDDEVDRPRKRIFAKRYSYKK